MCHFIKQERLLKLLCWLLWSGLMVAGGFGLLAYGGVNNALAQQASLTPPAGSAVISSTITFSPEAVVSYQPVLLTLSSPVTGGVIRYTTNGSVPDSNTMPYVQPLVISQSTVIRAQVFKNGVPFGNAQTRSYLIIDYEQTIPIVSIAGEGAHLQLLHDQPLFRGVEWERPINVEYFAPGGQPGFNVPAGIRIHGGKSRQVSPKKSYRLYFRKSYGGPGNLEYPLFPDSPVTTFDKLVLRAGYNDSFIYADSYGLATPATLNTKYISDQVVRNLHRDMGQPVAHGSWVLLYINGKFWGLYNLTERVDLQFLRAYSDKDSDWDVIKKEVGIDANNEWHNIETVVDGDYGGWEENQHWLGSADFTNPGNVGVLEWRVDMENVFSYMFLQAYVQNYDWPGNNWVAYRRKDPAAIGNEGKWRLLVWDAETTFGSGSNEGFKTDVNTLTKIYSPHDSITRILEKPFIHSCDLKFRFVQRAREYLGVENLNNRPEHEVGQLSKERVKAEILNQAAIIRPFIQMEANRWAPFMNTEIFDQNIQNTLRFVDERQDIILHHLDILKYETFTQCR